MGIGLVVLGLFVLVWIISAVVKATQDTGKRPPPNRARPPADAPRIERTSNTDIDRFMAEIDRLRRKGEGAPAGRSPADRPRPVQRPAVIDRPARLEPRPPRPAEARRERERDREKDRERRPRQAPRPTPPAPPPLPATDPLPVLRPVTPAPPSTAASAPIKPAQTARTIATTTVTSSTPTSPVMETLQTVLRGKQGPAAAVILAEIFGEPRARRPVQTKGQRT